MKEYLNVKDCGKEKYDFTGFKIAANLIDGFLKEARLDDIHMKEDATVDDKVGFAFLSTLPDVGFIVSQVSLATLADAFDRLGYRLEKK